MIADFSKARVLVVGDVMLDRFWHGDCSRISPEAPVPVVKIEQCEDRPGGAANVAMNIASLGAQASVIGIVGDDEAGRILQQCLHSNAVNGDLLKTSEHATVTKLRVLSRHQQLLRMDFEDGFAGFDTSLLLEHFRQGLTDAKAVVLSDYGKGVLPSAQPFIEMARQVNCPILVDPKGSDFSRYHGASLITPNLAEFQAVVGACRDDNELVEKGLRLMAELALGGLLITRSERGMTLLQCDQEPLHLPAQAREVYDVTGAGDTVIAVTAAALAAGLELQRATAFANIAAGIVVAKLGTASVSLNELEQALTKPSQSENAVLDEASLLSAVAAAKARGESIVMTNGCFDILHAGHISYLEKARQLGDRLVVAVNDDASTRRLKGARRPINQLAARMRLLAGLRAVDWVVSFGEDTPERLICRVLPDYLVKGGDYDPAEIAGAECVRRAGGEVVVMDYVEGFSTTRIVDQIEGRTQEL